MEEDDYLSDKFLVDPTSDAPKTYGQIRKEAERQSKLKNEKNKLKSRQRRELESREEGLSKSLFERAKEEKESGMGQALNIMMKMGFKPGQALGKDDGGDPLGQSAAAGASGSPPRGDGDRPEDRGAEPAEMGKPRAKHKAEPLPINDEWNAGKKGIGLGKRAPSPASAERVAKMAKMAEASSRDTFRDRTRMEYEERRAEGRLLSAQRTCVTLDEKAGKSFDVFWLNPHVPESFPEGLMDAITEHGSMPVIPSSYPRKTSIESRLRQQMQADALRPLSSAEEEGGGGVVDGSISRTELYNSETIQEAVGFLRLNAQDRLRLVLSYLRTKYAYCFWCGTQYEDESEMDKQCPGSDEEAHD